MVTPTPSRKPTFAVVVFLATSLPFAVAQHSWSADAICKDYQRVPNCDLIEDDCCLPPKLNGRDPNKPTEVPTSRPPEMPDSGEQRGGPNHGVLKLGPTVPSGR